MGDGHQGTRRRNGAAGLAASLLAAAMACSGCGPRGPGPGDAGPGDGAPDGDAEGPGDGAPDGDAEAREAGELVVVTLNTHSFQEGLDSLDKLRWIGEGLAALEVDLVGLNEVMSGTFWAYHFEGEEHDGADIVLEALEAASGERYHRARCGFAHWADGEEMANVALSRYPILEQSCRPLTTTDFWPAPDERRSVLGVRVEVPRLGPVGFFVTHAAGWGSVDVPAQVAEVRAFMVERLRGDEGLGLLVGDLNAPAGSEGYDLWLGAEPFGLVDTFGEAEPERFFATTLAGGTERIDYVLAGEGYAPVEAPREYGSAIVFDGGTFRGAELPVVSDHFGVATVFPLALP